MDFFVPGLVEGAGAFAREHGLIIDPRWAVRADWMPDQPGWDAVLVNIVDHDESLGRVASLRIPMVNMNQRTEHIFPKALFDYASCAAPVVEEFVRLGLERVAVVDWPTDPVERHARKGLLVEARKSALTVVPIEGWVSGYKLGESAERLVDALGSLGEGVGFFCAHAGLVYSMMKVMDRRDLRIPVIVIDKDVQRTAEMSPIPLTAVVPDFWQQGYEAARLAYEMLEGRLEPGRRKVVRSKFCQLVRRESTGSLTTKDPAVVKALHGIQESDLSILSVDAVVRYVGVSRRTLEQRFKRETRTTLHQAILNRQMDDATRLLIAGDMTVSEVADACGFSSVHYFSSAYKRERGVTPGSIRRTGAGGSGGSGAAG
ncbi:xylose operon regulatory protein [Haloferula helveola]